jgi:hypothetical protein
MCCTLCKMGCVPNKPLALEWRSSVVEAGTAVRMKMGLDLTELRKGQGPESAWVLPVDDCVSVSEWI